MNYIVNDFNHEVKTHRDFKDVSFYEDNSKITKVDLQALIPVPNGDAYAHEVTSPFDLKGKNKNSSKSDSFIYFQRILNRISQHDPDKKERKLYYYPRFFLFKGENIIENNFKRELVTAKQIQAFKNQFVESNKALAKEIQLHDQMEQSGYF